MPITPRENWNVRNNSSRTQVLDDLPSTPPIRSGAIVNLLKYHSKQEIQNSTTLAGLLRSGILVLTKKRNGTRRRLSTANSVNGVDSVEKNDLLREIDALDESEFLELDRLLNYPRVGPTKSTWRDGVDPTDGATTDQYLLKLGAGVSGVVRTIWTGMAFAFYPLGGDPILWTGGVAKTDFLNWRLRVYVDCGNISDSQITDPPEEYLDVEIPYAALIGAYFSPEPGSDRIVETDYLQINFQDTNYGKAIVFQFRYPIPFSNGVFIQTGYLDESEVWHPAGLSTEAHYFWVTYETGSLPPSLADYRLKCSSWEGDTFNDDAIFLEEETGSGVALGIWFSAYSDPDEYGLGFLEANWTFQTDGSGEDVWQSSGAEDLFGTLGVLYFSYGQFLNRLDGCLYTDNSDSEPNPSIVEAYKLFHRDPVYWTDGCTGFLPLYPNNPLQDGHIHCLYYQQI